MTVTFNGVILADGESRVVKVASGLAPSGEVQTEVLEYLRADWAVPVARGNRVVTLPMNIALPPCEDFGTALLQGLMYFADLPEEGALVVEHAGYRVSCAQAVCQRTKPTDSIEGLSNDLALQFICGELTSQLMILDEMGVILEDEGGDELEY